MQTMDTSNHVTSHPKKKKKVSHQSSSARRWRDSSFDLTKPEKVGKITWHEPGKSQHISHHWRKRNSSSPLSFQLSLGRKYNNCWYFGEVILPSTRDLGVFKWTMSKPRIDLVTFRPEVEVPDSWCHAQKQLCFNPLVLPSTHWRHAWARCVWVYFGAQ